MEKIEILQGNHSKSNFSYVINGESALIYIKKEIYLENDWNSDEITKILDLEGQIKRIEFNCSEHTGGKQNLSLLKKLISRQANIQEAIFTGEYQWPDFIEAIRYISKTNKSLSSVSLPMSWLKCLSFKEVRELRKLIYSLSCYQLAIFPYNKPFEDVFTQHVSFFGISRFKYKYCIDGEVQFSSRRIQLSRRIFKLEPKASFKNLQILELVSRSNTEQDTLCIFENLKLAQPPILRILRLEVFLGSLEKGICIIKRLINVINCLGSVEQSYIKLDSFQRKENLNTLTSMPQIKSQYIINFIRKHGSAQNVFHFSFLYRLKLLLEQRCRRLEHGVHRCIHKSSFSRDDLFLDVCVGYEDADLIS
eukprot:snap_masked-scaffold_38-processed-gene-2.65-mRNA-1 protein AED:1.00 eAED:1.00 QI:0/0/0/0/1/1/2/0/363